VTFYVALVRGINVGGRAVMSMAQLRGACTDLGCEDVQTYVQSGNVLFRSTATAARLVPAMERRLGEELGRPARVVLRTRSQLVDVLRRNPLSGGGRDDAKLHVTFLADRPAPSLVAALDTGAYLPEEFRVTTTAVYVHCPGGYGRSKITNNFFERALGVAATTRSLKTVTELVRRST